MDDRKLPEARLVPNQALAKTPEAEAAAFVADLGGSPREQIDAARKMRKTLGKPGSIGYTSHQGKRQRERALRRMAKADGDE